MTPFLWGIIAGAVLGFAALFVIIARIAHRANSRAARNEPDGPTDRELLATARRYLEQIAERTSLHEAQVIARKALKETGDSE